MDLSFIPFWAYWLLGGLFVLLVYKYFLDDMAKAEVMKFIKGYGVLIVIIIAYFFMRHYMGYFNESDFFGMEANTYGSLLLLLYALAVNFLGKERYKSTHAVCDNRSGSCAKYKEVGDYIILNIGSVDADMFPWSWGHETWVVPKRHFNKINNRPNASSTQIVIKTNVQKCDLTEVPSQCHDYIESTQGFHKEEVYYGEFSLDELLNKGIKLKDPEGKELTPTEYETKLKDTNRLLNEARSMIKGKTQTILGYVSHVGTIMKKAKGEGNRAPQSREEDYR